MIHPSLFLRRAILVDAVASGVMGLLMAVAAGMLAPILNLPDALLRDTGLFYIVYAALIGWLGTRRAMPKLLVLIVIAGNAAWTIGAVALLLSGAVAPNLLGQIFIASQGIVTAIFAELQYVGLRKSGGTVTA